MDSDLQSLTGLSIERLRTFCQIVEAGSMALAANRDPDRQSQFSRQIRELEGFLGAKLFQKQGKTLVLTEEGRRLAVLTQSYFGALAEFRAGSGAMAQVVKVGAGESVFRWIILPNLEELLGKTNNMVLEFQTRRTHQAVEQLKDGSLDVAIVREDALDTSLASHCFRVVDYKFVVPRRLLPEKTASTIQMVKEIPCALLSGDGLFANRVQIVATENVITLNVRTRADSFSLLVQAMLHSDLASFIPSQAIRELPADRFAVVELNGMERLRRRLVCAYHPKAAELRPVIRNTAQRLAMV